LIGKPENTATYEINLSPEQAFGKRNAQLIQRIPIKIFREQKINPVPGFSFNFDGRIGRVLASSSGRVIVDFNNPVAGKDVVYKVKILRKISDINEKAKALIKFLFRENLGFEIKDKKIIIEVEKQLAEFVKLFKEKFKDMLDLELEVKEIEKKIEEPKKSS
jgi:FKBP-type peptidyl-prolyl cis-trans isomerase 2